MTSATAHAGGTNPEPTRSPSPTITYHHSHLLPLQRHELIGSIAGGAHYAGALQSHNSDSEPPPLHPKAWRRQSTISCKADDPDINGTFKGVVEDLQQFYSGKPTPEAVQRRWCEEATWEHPLFKCTGISEIRAVLFALPLCVRSAEHISTRILSAGLAPNRLVCAQHYVYTIPLIGSRKDIKSVIYVDLDEDMKIVQLIDQWNGQEHSTRWGAASFRRLLAKVLCWISPAPKRHTG
ncbi:hypothetical protein C8Q70DRAFT_27083 [Cubamyces menziesii]|nr:hypothetical protein C8Q70DRAFT_27083 [Cubamyces menziesii]